jgi:hypothetical protein
MKKIAKAVGQTPKTRRKSGVNRRLKDSVFRKLFKDKARFRELYNAIKGTNYDENTAMVETTLSGVLYMKRKNDISYLIDGKLVVFMEHQSTMNRNIALRMLIYAGRMYEKLVGDENIYGPRKITVPRPEFYVLYNGTGKVPEKQTARLSEMFEDDGKKYPFSLDLEVTIYNINTGNNAELLSRSATLSQYETFIESVRKREKKHGLDKATEMAIAECVGRGILADFLKKHGSEIVNMLTSELNETKLRKLWVDYGVEKGLKKGRAEGIEELFTLLEKGIPLAKAKKMLLSRR